ncbi:ATP-binding protein [Coleofasciculus sp. FACHB-129]|uniref:sensor histidine kinase n=1 Tax=Cyanophyceae TaxID=3028117 RepID=UPI001686C8EC|nr:ATP-binding protein [Coleofasciculus sp. FACHB-129]MBD1894384.1 histidine kinase [Coleofasciculus sp. FACHB-129]
MTLIAFFVGLTLGIGFWIWRRNKLYRQLEQILGLLPSSVIGVSLPLVSQLRSGIALANQQSLQLKTQLQMNQEILQVAPIGYLEVDEENQLIWCNEQARILLELHRWEPGQVRLLLELVRSYELDQLIEQTRHQQKPCEQEWVFHPDCSDAAVIGEMRSLTLRASSLPLAYGQVGVFLENRQPLIELSQSRDRWVSDLAHELRTPLTSIRLVTETLQKRLQSTKERSLIDRLLPEVNRLMNLVQDWLELSHLEQDPSKHLTLKLVELRSLIHSAWETIEPLARQKQLSFSYSGSDTLLIKADASRLTQVFLNLLDNSIKYSPLEGAIRVEVNLIPNKDIPNLVQINIIDSGIGFPEFDLPHVFERLYRGDPSRRRQHNSSGTSEELSVVVTTGSGLGLAIVRQIVIAHGGSVKAKNHPETGGAWLQIELPSFQSPLKI